jgi:hypothetical protein
MSGEDTQKRLHKILLIFSRPEYVDHFRSDFSDFSHTPLRLLKSHVAAGRELTARCQAYVSFHSPSLQCDVVDPVSDLYVPSSESFL